MKKFLLALLFIGAVVLAPSVTYASSMWFNTEGTLYVVKCDEWISLRSAPSTDAPVITRIPLGDEVRVLDDSDGMAEFAHVNYRGMNGYALYEYLSPSSMCYRVVNCREWISLRAAPSTEATRLCIIPLGELVRHVRNAENGFTYVYYKGNLGYALSKYLD